MISLIVAIALAAMGDITQPAYRLEEGDTNFPVYELEGIVITATRIYQPLKDVPIATTLITRKEIMSSNGQNVSDVIRDVAGVYIKSYGTHGAVSSVSLRGSTSQQVLVLLDGRPINSISTGNADLSKVPLNNIERIEVVRGPTSHLYGANAMGGVVNVITREPPEKMNTNAYGSYGAFNTKVFCLEHGRKFSNLGYLAVVEMKNSDGFRDNSDYEAVDLSTKLGYRINRRLEAKATLLFHNDRFGVPGAVPPEDSSAKYGNEKVTSLFDRSRGRDISGDFNLLWKPNRFSNLTFRSYFDRSKLNYIWRHDDWWHWTSDTLDENDEYVTEIIGSSLQYQHNFAKLVVVTGGADVRKLKFNATQRMVDISTGEDTTNEWNPKDTEYGAWVESQGRIQNLLIVTSGVRYDYHSKYGSVVNPNIGVVYHPGTNTAIRASLGKAYRAPSFNDLYWPTSGNPDLVPESGWGFEMGFKQTFYSILTVDISLFKRETEDKIAWSPDTGGNWNPQNINQHTCRGGEFEIKSMFSKRFSVGFTYTYLDAKQTNKEVVYSDWLTGEIRQEFKTRKAAFTPEHGIGANVTFKPATGTQLNLGARFVGERINYYPNYGKPPFVTMDTKKLKSYAVINGKLIQEVIRNLKLSVGMNNIFDEDYMEQFGTAFMDRGYPMLPRAYTIRLYYSL